MQHLTEILLLCMAPALCSFDEVRSGETFSIILTRKYDDVHVHQGHASRNWFRDRQRFRVVVGGETVRVTKLPRQGGE